MSKAMDLLRRGYDILDAHDFEWFDVEFDRPFADGGLVPEPAAA